jgi:hypothetical protein
MSGCGCGGSCGGSGGYGCGSGSLSPTIWDLGAQRLDLASAQDMADLRVGGKHDDCGCGCNGAGSCANGVSGMAKAGGKSLFQRPQSFQFNRGHLNCGAIYNLYGADPSGMSYGPDPDPYSYRFQRPAIALGVGSGLGGLRGLGDINSDGSVGAGTTILYSAQVSVGINLSGADISSALAAVPQLAAPALTGVTVTTSAGAINSVLSSIGLPTGTFTVTIQATAAIDRAQATDIQGDLDNALSMAGFSVQASTPVCQVGTAGCGPIISAASGSDLSTQIQNFLSGLGGSSTLILVALAGVLAYSVLEKR